MYLAKLVFQEEWVNTASDRHYSSAKLEKYAFLSVSIMSLGIIVL
jgi:hypothetical protein